MNWDLSVFYKGFDDPQIERDFARCDEITVEKQAVLKQGLSVRETLEKYMALSRCPAHGMALGQMHFKRAQSGTLIMHQRTYAASGEEIADVRERYRLYQLTPPRKRHHRLNMEDAVVKKGARPDEQA